MKILLGITGSISAYKALDVISGLISTGNEVKVIVTNSALQFVTEMSLATISKGKVYKDGAIDLDGKVTHIDLANWCDVFACAPASANSIAKFACALGDNLLTDTFLALPKETPRLIVPAMNTNMWDNNRTQRNVAELKTFCKVMEPDEGMLACGVKGKGKLPKPRAIVEFINNKGGKICDLS